MNEYTMVSGCGEHAEFEIHAASCTSIAKYPSWGNRWTVEAESPEQIVAEDVAVYEEQDQGWTADDFYIFPCARKAQS